MPKIKLTKTELKKQRDSLSQFRRFLPTLLLKKQQLQMETGGCEERIKANIAKIQELKADMADWISLFGPAGAPARLERALSVEKIITEETNIAGVPLPVYKSVVFKCESYSLFEEELWLDSAVEALRRIIELEAERTVIQEQWRRLSAELRVTTQRVNLFEKVKIPESRENIRTIQIYLGDMDTAAVGRSKIAKRKSQARDDQEAPAA
jgi:V/A-type H+-transporting ATPase subunit D